MRKNIIAIIATVCLVVGLAATVHAQNINWAAQRKQMKSQQRLERNELKVQQHNRRQSWGARRTTSAERAQANHQMRRERRDLKQRQKDAMQDMKDRKRSLASMRHAYNR